jgi:hypothetical protein
MKNRRIDKESIPLKKDIIKIESIEKTWDKAITIIKQKSTLYLLKRLDYIGKDRRLNFRGFYRIIPKILF